MYYTYTSKLLTKMLDNSFEFPYTLEKFSDILAYDHVKTDKSGNSKITVTVPGYAKEDLVLTVTDDTLCLSDKEDKKLKKFWKLSDLTDVKNIKADCKNGLLTIDIPVREKKEQTHKITIE